MEYAYLSFQSPLHRGRVFNKARGIALDSRTGAFSPLFIGEGSSTNAMTIPNRGRKTFQSPLHRGRVFNATARRASWWPTATFSPLSGKGLQPQIRTVGDANRVLSVPSSSGKGLQRRRVSSRPGP